MMATKTIDLNETEAQIAELLSLLSEGTEIVFADGDKPFAKLVRITETGKARVPGLHEGAIWMSDDFDEPLPNGFWIGNE
jgi:antitoxin (DNA-binding transcriptional repressor) of toxin-antitoxin stability system